MRNLFLSLATLAALAVSADTALAQRRGRVIVSSAPYSGYVAPYYNSYVAPFTGNYVVPSTSYYSPYSSGYTYSSGYVTPSYSSGYVTPATSYYSPYSSGSYVMPAAGLSVGRGYNFYPGRGYSSYPGYRYWW